MLGEAKGRLVRSTNLLVCPFVGMGIQIAILSTDKSIILKPCPRIGRTITTGAVTSNKVLPMALAVTMVLMMELKDRRILTKDTVGRTKGVIASPTAMMRRTIISHTAGKVAITNPVLKETTE